MAPPVAKRYSYKRREEKSRSLGCYQSGDQDREMTLLLQSEVNELGVGTHTKNSESLVKLDMAFSWRKRNISFGKDT
jgi:phage tail tube protein FII